MLNTFDTGHQDMVVRRRMRTVGRRGGPSARRSHARPAVLRRGRVRGHTGKRQHDAQLDYYGRRLATCASDKSVRVCEVEAGAQRLVEVLRKHDGPVWQVAWAHPRFGNYLASCSYDGQVIVWGEFNGRWDAVHHHRAHEASGAFAPPAHATAHTTLGRSSSRT